MRTKEAPWSLTDTSPAAASTVVSTSFAKGGMLWQADKLIVDAALIGGTGGTLDIYLQRKLGTNRWVDWIHFPQLAAGATKKYSFAITGEGTTIVEVGGGTDVSPGVALAANTAVNVLPTGDVRMIFVAGAGTSAGALQRIDIIPFTERH